MTPQLRSPLQLTALALATLMLGGCILSAPYLDPVRRDLEATLPGIELEPQIQVRLGRLSLGMVKGIARMAAEGDGADEEALDLMRHIKGVEVAIYETDHLTADAEQRVHRYLTDLGQRRGWVPVASIRDDDTTGSVFFQTKGETIHRVYFFGMEEDNFMMVRFKGKLDRILAEALALRSREIGSAVAGDVAEEASAEEKEKAEAKEATAEAL